MDLNKFTVGSKWVDKSFPFLRILKVTEVNESQVILCGKNTRGDTFTASYHLDSLSELLPYEEPKPDWKDNYPVGSEWKYKDSKVRIIYHQPKTDMTEDCLIYAFLKPNTLSEYRIYWETKEAVLDGFKPYKAPASGVFWFNINRSMIGRGFDASHPYLTKEQADEGSIGSRVACKPLPWTEGEGL